MKRIVVGTLVLPALLLAAATQASAASFTVNSTADGVDATPGNGTCATAGGTCTLRAAVQEANALAGPDAITLPAGFFFLTLTGVAEDAAATGDLDVTQPLEITGAGVDDTIVDGLGADRVFDVASGNAFTLRGLTVRNGASGAEPGGGLVHDGGAATVIEDAAFVANRGDMAAAMLVTNGALTLRRTRIADNRTQDGDGMVMHIGMAQPLEVRDSVVEGNVTFGGSSSGILYQGTANVTVTGTRFSRNTAEALGGLLVGTTGAVTLEDLVVEDNRVAQQVGGLMVNGAATVDVRRSTFRDNTALSLGGFYILSAGATTLTDVAIEGNEADTAAGCIVQSGATLTVQDTRLVGNRAIATAIAGAQLSAAGAITLDRLTVRDNVAATDIGGVYVQSGAGSIALRDSVVEGNVALAGDVGGGYLSAAAAEVVTERTLVRGNQAFDGAVGGLYLSGTTTRIATSTFADNLVVGGAGTGGGVYAGGITTVTNSTFSGNVASTAGGGLYMATGGSIDSCTFTGNVSTMPGSAILAPPAVTIRGTVVAAGSGDSCSVALTSGGDNVDQDGTCGLAGPRDRSSIDPQLGLLQDNGGPTPTHEPLPGSPLIDGDGGVCPATDQRGVARPTDGNGDGTPTCDVGAVEFVDECPQDPDKRLPGVCGCGVADVDANANGAIDCLVNAELKARIATEKTSMQAITGVKSDEQTALKSAVKAGADDLLAYVDANGATIVKVDPAADLAKLAKKARKLVRRTLKGKGKALQKKQGKAATALDTFDAAVAPQ